MKTLRFLFAAAIIVVFVQTSTGVNAYPDLDKHHAMLAWRMWVQAEIIGR